MENKSLKPDFSITIPERSVFILPALTIWTAAVINLGSRKFQVTIPDILSALQHKSPIFISGIVLLAVYTVFIAGHILDLLSNGINERFLANKMDGFPHERLVPFANTTNSHEHFTNRKLTNIRSPKFIYEGAKLIICIGALYSITRIVERYDILELTPSPKSAIRIFKWYLAYGLAFAIALATPAVIIGFIPISTGKDRLRFVREIKIHISRWFQLRPLLKKPIRYGILLLIAPAVPLLYAYDVVDRLVRRSVRLNTEIDIQTFRGVQAASKLKLGMEYQKLENNDRFWLPYLCVHRELPTIARKVDEARKSANFCRNQSLACFLAALMLSGAYISLPQNPWGEVTKKDLLNLSLALFCVAWLFHWKFLHHYYAFSKMTIRGFALLGSTASSQRQSKKRSPQNSQKPPPKELSIAG